MFVVLLRFSENKARAAQFMEGHKKWIKRGFDDGVFLLTGTIQSGIGGAILAHNTARPDLEERMKQDPFVAENVVSAEIIEVAPGKADDRLAFLMS